MSTLLEAALGYARRKRPVFPVSRNKKPLTEHGFEDATTDEAQISEWWKAHPRAGIATPTGQGLFVLDVDDESALTALVTEHGPLPPTPEVVTPRPGRHIYLRGEVTNARGRLPDGIDVRGRGGYVLLPPSPHRNGRYEWRTAPDEAGFAPAPEWLLALLDDGRNGQAPLVEGDIPQTQRNTTLTSMAGTMRRRGFSERAIAAALLVENEDRCKPPLSDRDVRKIARSVSRYKPADDAVATTDQLTELLGLDEVGKRIDVVKTFGRGSTAIVHVELDDGERLVFDPIGKFTTVNKLVSELALTTGARPRLKADQIVEALVLIKKLGQHHVNVEIEDRAGGLGADYLSVATVADVDMNDQASRWEAFARLERAKDEHVVLWDQASGIRYVKISSFESYVRGRVGVADPIVREMLTLGWHKRGAEGKIKATNPEFEATLSFRFFEVPEGWET